MLSHKRQSFPDGVVKIYTVGDVSSPGDMPKDGLILKESLRYKERTVGINRFYSALQNSVKVAFVLRCPLVRSVSTSDVAVMPDLVQFEIKQVQYPEDQEPPVMDLTLERIGEPYATS